MTVITGGPFCYIVFVTLNKIHFCEEIIYIYLDFFIKNIFHFYNIFNRKFYSSNCLKELGFLCIFK